MIGRYSTPLKQHRENPVMMYIIYTLGYDFCVYISLLGSETADFGCVCKTLSVS